MLGIEQIFPKPGPCFIGRAKDPGFVMVQWRAGIEESQVFEFHRFDYDGLLDATIGDR